MKLQIIETAVNRNEASGTSIWNDGTKSYWTEGNSETIHIKADGTRIASYVYDDKSEYGVILMQDDTIYNNRDATRAEEVEFEMISGGLSREEAENNIAELDNEYEGMFD